MRHLCQLHIDNLVWHWTVSEILIATSLFDRVEVSLGDPSQPNAPLGLSWLPAEARKPGSDKDALPAMLDLVCVKSINPDGLAGGHPQLCVGMCLTDCSSAERHVALIGMSFSETIQVIRSMSRPIKLRLFLPSEPASPSPKHARAASPGFGSNEDDATVTCTVTFVNKGAVTFVCNGDLCTR